MIQLTSIKVNPKNLYLVEGTWYHDTNVEYFPQNATCKCVTWRTNDNTIASINYTNGFIYAKSPGKTTLYATSCDGSNCEDFINITVVKKELINKIKFEKSKISIEIGTSKSIFPLIEPSYASNKNLDWYSSDTCIATVENGKIKAISLGKATITAKTKDGTNLSATFELTVTNDILVHSINLPSHITIDTNTAKTVEISMVPYNAANKEYYFSVSDDNMLNAYEDPNGKGVIISNTIIGTVTLFVEAADQSGTIGKCEVEIVTPTPATSITLIDKKIMLHLNEKLILAPQLTPSNATFMSVNFISKNTSIATVSKNGEIKGLSQGTTVIEVVSKDNPEIKDSCEIKVIDIESRENVIVESDGDNDQYFTTYFNNGLVWKNINCNMFLPENHSSPSVISNELYEDMYKHEVRFYENLKNFKYMLNVTSLESLVPQFSLLYLLDPLGITYFLATLGNRILTISNHDLLIFKDKVFKKIFGNKEPNKFYFIKNNDDGISYINYNPQKINRENIYSIAEILFGVHQVEKNYFHVLVYEIFKVKFDSTIGSDLEKLDMLYSLFFAGSATDLYSNSAKTFLTEYASDIAEKYIKDLIGKSVYKCVEAILNCIKIIFRTGKHFAPPNTNDISIYNKVNEQNEFNVIFKKFYNQISMEQIIYLTNNK